jgi:hypothetical protein
MSDQIPLYKVSDSGMTAPLNWTYAPDFHGSNLPYNVFDLDVRLDAGFNGLGKLEKGVPVSHDYRSLFFSSTTDYSLVFLDQRTSCLHILSPKDKAVTGLPPKVERTLPLSNLNVIIANPQQVSHPPSIVFGVEPVHDWCYFYQKADLARQENDWQQVVSLWKQAGDQSLKPLDSFELLPFIESLAFEKDFNQAGTLSKIVYQDSRLRKRLCISWDDIRNAPGMLNEKESILAIMKTIDCSN